MIGNAKCHEVAPGSPMCGGAPHEATAGAPPRPDPERARPFDGRPIPVLEPMQKLPAAFARGTDLARGKQIAMEAQVLGVDEVLVVPRRPLVVPGAFRNNVPGVRQFGATLLRDISV